MLQVSRRLAEEPEPAARVLCVASGKGGTGKSVLATNVAVQRARRGERVLLVDFDTGLANAHLLLGVTPRYDLAHVMDGHVEPEEAMVEGPAGVQLLSGGVGREALANPTRRELDRLFRSLSKLETRFDLLVIDHGAGLGYGTLAHLAATNTLLLVSSHEVTALSDAYALYKRATAVNEGLRVGMVVNRAPDGDAAQAAWERFRSAAHRFLGHEPELLGWVPGDPAVTRSVQDRVPVTLNEPEAEASRAIRRVARWERIDHARTVRPFYATARRALR